MTNPVNHISSCTKHFPRPFQTPSYTLIQHYPTIPSNSSSRRITSGKCSNISSKIRPLVSVAKHSVCRNIFIICKLSLHKTFTILSIVHPSSKRIYSYPDKIFAPNSSLKKSSPKSWPTKVFPHLLAPSTPTFLIFSLNTVTQLSMKKTPLITSTVTWKPPRPLLTLYPKHLPQAITHYTLPSMTSPPWHPHNHPRTHPLPLPMPLMFPGPHFSNSNSTWTPTLLPSQENIVMHANRPDTLQTTAVNMA